MIEFEYPWYRGGDFGDAIEQGDILDDFPIYLPQRQFGLEAANPLIAEFDWEERNVVVMSQTCDMVLGREKLDEVLLCAVWDSDELLQRQHANRKTLEDMRRGNMPGYHVLASCDLVGHERGPRVVDFRRVYSTPLTFIRTWALDRDSRLRLCPPYREHLSQAFARFFMRVGLPTDIPSF